MVDDDKALVERLWSRVKYRWDGQTQIREIDTDATYAAHRIEELSAEVERLEKAIKVQASAVRTLQANEETEINMLRKQKAEWHRAVSSLDSEREANAILTVENERLREAGKDLGFYAGHDDSCDCVKGWAKGPCNCGYTETWKQWSAALGETK